MNGELINLFSETAGSNKLTIINEAHLVLSGRASRPVHAVIAGKSLWPLLALWACVSHTGIRYNNNLQVRVQQTRMVRQHPSVCSVYFTGTQ